MHKVLVVEDEKILRDAYEKVLTMEGFDVIVATNGQEALKHIRTKQPDLILLDILMPMMDGLEFLKKAKIKQRYPTTKIIAFSNLSDQQKLDAMMELGVVRHMLKSSVSPKELVQQARELLSA